VDFGIDPRMRAELEEAREWGRSRMRPAGLEADRNGAPLPPDHAYFEAFVAAGKGRTRWQGSDAVRADPPRDRTVLTLLLAEETAYWDRGVVVAGPGPGLPEPNVLALGTEEQKERFLGPFRKLDRPRWACFGMTEPGAGSDAAAIATLARPDGDGFILKGAKCFIGNASSSDWILVESTSFRLEDCRVPAANLLGGTQRKERKAGFKTAMRTFNAGRPVIAANAVGIGRAALDEVLAFAREHDRVEDPRVRDRLETLARKLRMARLICLRAGWLADAQRPNIVEASMAKAVAASVAQETTSLGLELLGSVGARGDHLIEKLYRDAKAMDIVEGTGQIQRVIMARQLVGLPRS
jgi:acyl-CoA dehydrogenase